MYIDNLDCFMHIGRHEINWQQTNVCVSNFKTAYFLAPFARSLDINALHIYMHNFKGENTFFLCAAQ